MSDTQNRLASMTGLLAELVSRPSRTGEDSCDATLHCIAAWLTQRGVANHWLHDGDGQVLGLWGEIGGARPGPLYVLNAPADTAPFGERTAWRHPPERATVSDGWLYGRGAADSKAGIAVFCHVIADLAPQRDTLRGKLGFVFDAEEHSGSFAGIRRYLETRAHETISGVMIGYPGNDKVVVGARGFLRACVHVHGVAAHSGSSSGNGINAIERARQLLDSMAGSPLPDADSQFPLPPKVTATGIRGGGSYTLIPDHCALDIDMRLTPAFDAAAAQRWLGRLTTTLDAHGVAPATTITWQPGWPAYRLSADHPMVAALTAAAREAFGHEIPPAVVGPSSIANLLATQGIPATAGLGVTYRNIHAPDECVELASLEATYQTYLRAARRLLK